MLTSLLYGCQNTNCLSARVVVFQFLPTTTLSHPCIPIFYSFVLNEHSFFVLLLFFTLMNRVPIKSSSRYRQFDVFFVISSTARPSTNSCFLDAIFFPFSYNSLQSSSINSVQSQAFSYRFTHQFVRFLSVPFSTITCTREMDFFFRKFSLRVEFLHCVLWKN